MAQEFHDISKFILSHKATTLVKHGDSGNTHITHQLSVNTCVIQQFHNLYHILSWHRDILCMLFTTRVMTGLWNVIPPGMSAAGQKINITCIHSSDSHAKSTQ